MKFLIEGEVEPEDIVRLALRKVSDKRGDAVNIIKVDSDGNELVKLAQINVYGIYLFENLTDEVPFSMRSACNNYRLSQANTFIGDQNIPF